MQTRANVKHTLDVSAELKNLAAIRHFVEDTAKFLGASSDAIEDLIQAVDESAANIVLHGYEGRPGRIEVEIRPDGNALVVCMRDQAPPFDPTRIPPPDLTLPLEERRLGGLGIYLARQFTDGMSHRITPKGGNELTLRKKIK